MKIPFQLPTDKQINYMQILFNDLGFTWDKRNAWLSLVFERPIKYLDQITRGEATIVIENLKEMKENKEDWGEKDAISD